MQMGRCDEFLWLQRGERKGSERRPASIHSSQRGVPKTGFSPNVEQKLPELTSRGNVLGKRKRGGRGGRYEDVYSLLTLYFLLSIPQNLNPPVLLNFSYFDQYRPKSRMWAGKEFSYGGDSLRPRTFDTLLMYSLIYFIHNIRKVRFGWFSAWPRTL
jgi:hypothetical protein